MRWHLESANSYNIPPPLYIVAKPGHMIDCIPFRQNNAINRCQNRDESQSLTAGDKNVGAHGYELREEPDMMAMMIVNGPHFKKLGIDKQRDSYNNLDFYPILTKLLGI